MSDDNDFDNDEGEGIANLRKQYEAQAKELKTLKETLGGYQAKERTASVSEMLKAKGLDDAKATKAASLYAKSSEDTSEDAVGAWFDEYADVLGVVKQDDQNATNAQRLADASGESAATEQLGTDKLVGDPAEMMNLIATLPYEELTKLNAKMFPARTNRL